MEPRAPEENPVAAPFQLMQDGNLIRMVPRVSSANAPDRTADRTESVSLDEGSDSCDAVVISHVPYSDSGKLRGKRDNFMPSCSNENNYPDVIYSYTPARSGLHGIYADGETYWGSVSIRTDGNCPGASEIMCTRMGQYAVISLTQGVTYYMIVDGNNYSDGDYELRLTAASPCRADVELAAPGIVSGQTCFAGDDCPNGEGDEQFVRITVPAAGYWDFSLCDGEEWRAKIYLTRNCCEGTILASAIDGCPYHSLTGTSRPVLQSVYLQSGIYYLAIDGGTYRNCGPWTLDVRESADRPRPANDDCADAGVPASLPAVLSGNSTFATKDCDLLSGSTGEVWHSFILDEQANVVIERDNSYTSNVGAYTVLSTGCPCQNLITATDINYGSYASVWSTFLYFPNLPAGIYYYPVPGIGPYDQDGTYEVRIRTSRTWFVEMQSGDVEECLDNPQSALNDTDCNGGCRTTGNAMQHIELGQPVFGRSFTYMVQTYRRVDEDWYEFSLSDTSAVTITMNAEFAVHITVYDNVCSYSSYADNISSSPDGQMIFTTPCLRPGTYAVHMRPFWDMPMTDFKYYRFTAAETPCTWPCDVHMETGNIPEGEPVCLDNYEDEYNNGCDGYPSYYQNIECGQTIFGSSGAFRMNNYEVRDTDWYQFMVGSPSIISIKLLAEFDSWMLFSNYCPGCDGGMAEKSSRAGDTLSITMTCLEAGTYICAVYPESWHFLPCGANYRLWVTCEPCSPCPSLYQPGDFVETEPRCELYGSYYDTLNGGCNSNPPRFGTALHCGQSYFGKTGTWWSGGPQRDTDWLPITLDGNVTPTWCVKAQFPVLAAIVGPGPHNPCDSIQVYSNVAAGSACETVSVTTNGPLDAGTYWLFIAPDAFSGITCGLEYRAWITCEPCVPHRVTDLTIWYNGTDVVLNWSDSPDFAGTYSVYHANSFADLENGTMQLLAKKIASTKGDGKESFTHTGITDSAVKQYYIVVGECP